MRGTLAGGVGAVLGAVWCSAATGMSPPRAGKADVVKELFPWYEIGQTADVAKGLELRQTHAAGAGLRAYELYRIVDEAQPTNRRAFVTLSVPERKVLSIQLEIECGTTNAANRLAAELIERIKPLNFKGGSKVIEISPCASAAAKDEPPTTVVIATLADVGYHRELSAWLKACE